MVNIDNTKHLTILLSIDNKQKSNLASHQPTIPQNHQPALPT